MKKSKVFLGFIILVIIIGLVGFVLYKIDNGENLIIKKKNIAKIDDWCYEPEESEEGAFYKSTLTNSFQTMDASAVSGAVSSESTIGYSVGGAKDINNFRENIKKGFFPLESDITYEGLFYDYSFETGSKESVNSDKMFYPTYSTAISKDPISEKDEYYVSVGLNSNIKESDFSRKKLNLVLVLDISGSMSSSIDNYYYDFNDKESEKKSKMKLAEESINVLLDQLNEDDKVGLVLFDDQGYLAKPLNLVGETDIDAIKEHILDVEAMGGTNFEAGYNLANEQFEKNEIGNSSDYENRIIVITDAMPNMGETSKDGLKDLMEENADRNIYTSFIGVGLDFNSEVVKGITDVKGANYYSVSSEKEFKTRIGDEFEYMVTPMVFDLNMDLISSDYEIEKIYGTDSLNSETGNIMHVNTLFPSKTNSDGEVKGGIILLKLKKKNESGKDLKLKVSYKTRDGQKDSDEIDVKFSKEENYYDNTGIRKGILLSRYTNLIKNWTEFERSKDDRFLITPVIGIIDYEDETTEKNNDDDYYGYYSENERTSVELTVSDKYKDIFKKFKEYMKSEIEAIDDDTLEQEIEILDKILE